jgi:5'-nucleotidase
MGDITVGDLMRVEPFGNELVVVQMSGLDVLRIFERKSSRGSSGIAFSGAKVVVDPDAPFGSRVLELIIAGQPLDLDRTYRVVTTDYLMEGNSGLDFLAQIDPDTCDYTMQLVRNALTQCLEANSPVRPIVDDRWREKPGGKRAAYLAAASVP